MKQKLIISLIGLIACHLTATAQVIFTEDPYIFLNMDLEAKEKSALLTVETRSDRARMKSFPQMTITLMNDSVLILTGKNHNSSTKINSQDIGGTVDKDQLASKALIILTPEQAEMFKSGIKSIEIPMTTYNFFREWASDELGSKLYSRYTESKKRGF